MMGDFIADSPKLAFWLLASLAALGGVALLFLAWRSRLRLPRASIAALAGMALLYAAVLVAAYVRMNWLDFELQERTGYEVSSYRLWTLEDAAPRTLGDFRGRPVLLYLWATFCGPCRPSLPVLGQLASDMEGRATVILLSHEDRSTLMGFARRPRPPAIVAYAPAPGRAAGGMWAFPQGTTPTTFLIDSHGVVRRVMVGHRSGGYLRAALEELVVPSTKALIGHDAALASGLALLEGDAARPHEAVE
jgi:thiol-disulfide isomerase/thioredoxin